CKSRNPHRSFTSTDRLDTRPFHAPHACRCRVSENHFLVSRCCQSRVKARSPKFTLKRDWRSVAWSFATIAVGVFVFSPGSWLAKTLYVLGCCRAIFAIVLLSTRDNQRTAKKLRTKLLRVTPEVYFGHDGLFCDGVYTIWLSLNIYLKSSSIDERQPRSLLLRFEKVVSNPYTGNQ